MPIEWPQNCRYWKLPRVVKFLDEFSLNCYHFHGCMLGTTDDEGTPIKKPWTLATSMSEIGEELVQFSAMATTLMCRGEENH